MKDKKVLKIDFSEKRLGEIADKYYNEGDFLSAIRFAYKQMELYGGNGEIFARLSDICEGMGLHGSAINWWFRYLDIATEEELPDVYEGLAVNFLNTGNEGQSAYYYNKLIDADDMLPDETKLDIATAFSQDKRDKFRFVYPPKLADYSKEMNLGARALKAGDCKRAIQEFSVVEEGSKEYVNAKEMQAVAYLLSGDIQQAETLCETLLEEYPNDIRLQATLAAAYMEGEKFDKSRAIAERLAKCETADTEELYKIATVCCENGLHEEAYERFCILDEKTPYDGRILYFKGVSAYKSGKIREAETALHKLCTVYPDAEVAKYYLRAIRLYQEGAGEKPELIYFYHLPQEEREQRCKSLLQISKCPKDEAQVFGLIALHDGYFRWCFDEMDGNDHDLQYLALVTAEHVRADDFLREVLLDSDVADVLKVETLRMLLLRNEDADFGIVLCNIYKRAFLHRIKIGRKRRKRFLEGYAKVASKFLILNDGNGRRMQRAAEELYAALEKYNSLDLIDSSDDCACAIYWEAGLKEMGRDLSTVALAFDANEAKVRVLLSALEYQRLGLDNK